MSREEDQRMREDASPDEGRKLANRVNHSDRQSTAMQFLKGRLTSNMPH